MKDDYVSVKILRAIGMLIVFAITLTALSYPWLLLDEVEYNLKYGRSHQPLLFCVVSFLAITWVAITAYLIGRGNGEKNQQKTIDRLEDEIRQLRRQMAEELEPEAPEEKTPADRSNSKPADETTQHLNSLIKRLTSHQDK